MALWILQNQYTANVLSDLRTICPDPGLTIDASGKISYVQTMSSVGCDTLALLQSRGTVAIRGENDAWSASPMPGRTLREDGGVTIFDVFPGTRAVDIVYDATNCNGQGLVTIDPQGVLIPLPLDVLLFHELAHAAEMFLGVYNPANPEPSAINAENAYRASRGLPQRGGWAGGCQGSYSPGPVSLQIVVHLENIGDIAFRENELAGTRGQSRRLEGFSVTISPAIPGLTLRYMAHLQDIGDTPFVNEGQFVGTRGQSRRLEGFAINLIGSSASNYDVSYMAHLQGIGDTAFYQNGQFCGTRGQSRRVEGILVRIVPH
jgi:hypothetical protein